MYATASSGGAGWSSRSTRAPPVWSRAVAPAGYGKTTLLTQWAASDTRPFAWMTLSEVDNDRGPLLAHLLLALEQVHAVAPEAFEAIVFTEADLVRVVLPRLGSVVAASSPFVLVVDDVHVLRNRGALDVFRAAIEHLPAGSCVAFAGRSEPALPLAKWRAGREVIDVGIDDLAMSVEESAALLRAAADRGGRRRGGPPQRGHRRLARRPLPQHVGDAGARFEPRARRDVVRRRGSPRRRVLPRRGAQGGTGRARAVPRPFVDTRRALRPALRRGTRAQRVGGAARPARAVEPVRGRAGPDARVVPLSPLVPRPAARRAAPSRTRARGGAAPPGE